MSYKRILRRAGRIFSAQAWAAVDALLGRDEQDLHAFDEELRRAASRDSASHESSSTSQQESSSHRGSTTHRDSTSESKRGEASGAPPPRGTRKPGEKGDDHYLRVLGLQEDATPDTIRRQYRRLMATYHPDRTLSLPAAERRRMTARAAEISEAYAILQRRWGFR